MASSVESAVLMMCIALPVMFVVIGLFIGCTKALVKMCPADKE